MRRASVDRGVLVGELAERLERPRTDVSPVADALFELIAEHLAAGDEVAYRMFGRFEARSMKPRTMRVPGADAPVQVPAKVKPAFVASPALKERVNRVRH